MYFYPTMNADPNRTLRPYKNAISGNVIVEWDKQKITEDDLDTLMREDGARMEIEITLWNKLISESVKRDENSDPNVLEVQFYNDIATVSGSMKKHYEHYKGKLGLWNEDGKELLRNGSKDELMRRVDDVVELYFDPMEMVRRDPEVYTCPYCGGYDDECTLCNGECVKDPCHNRALYGTHVDPDSPEAKEEADYYVAPTQIVEPPEVSRKRAREEESRELKKARSDTESRNLVLQEIEDSVELKKARFTFPQQGIGYCLICNSWHGNPRQLCKKSICGNEGMWFYDSGEGSHVVHQE